MNAKNMFYLYFYSNLSFVLNCKELGCVCVCIYGMERNCTLIKDIEVHATVPIIMHQVLAGSILLFPIPCIFKCTCIYVHFKKMYTLKKKMYKITFWEKNGHTFLRRACICLTYSLNILMLFLHLQPLHASQP